MKYVSIDIETLGLDPDYCDIIEFGAVIDNKQKLPLDKLPRFHAYILPPKRVVNGKRAFFYQGQPYAMQMHQKILERIAKREAGYRYLEPKMLGFYFAKFLEHEGDYEMKWEVRSTGTGEDEFEHFLEKPKDVVIAGKNFAGFDMRFLRRLPRFETLINIRHRQFDPANLYFDPAKDDLPPGLDECLKRAGMEKAVAHTAVEDAIDVIKVLRHKWGWPV